MDEDVRVSEQLLEMDRDIQVTRRLLPMPDGTKKKAEEEEDVISKAIGEYGRWQLLNTFILSLFNVPCTWHIFAPTFHVGEKRNAWCKRPENYNDVDIEQWMNCSGQSENNFCDIVNVTGLNNITELCGADLELLGRSKCSSWEFDGEGTTIITDFNLICGQENLQNFAEMLFLAGVAIGGLVSGIISDKYGRKKTLMISVTIQTLVGTLIAFSPWFLFYAIFRAVLGFVSVSVVFSGFVLSLELVGGDWRTITGISYLFPVSVSYITVSGIAWLLRDWRHFQLAISIPGFLFFTLWWVLPESPRWLLAFGKTKEVMYILKRASKFNNKPLPANLDKQLQPNLRSPSIENVSVFDLFRTSSMRKKTFCQFVIWFSVYLVYYGLVLNLSNIGGNLYINSALQGAVEIPAIAISIYILLKKGRRWPLSLTMMISGVSCILTVPIYFLNKDQQWLVTLLIMIGKFCISSSNAIMPVFAAELYPTTIRNIGVGAANITAGIALMIVPYLWLLSSFHTSVPMVVLAGCGILGGLCVLILPETHGVPLSSTIKEENEIRRMSIAEVPKNKMNNNCSGLQ
ncbi:organic cation transporter protein-like isoform X1 [Diorhabda carinulata]|uniref:organic cation transporter protein-like isoform X1 n=1 Tax=Diorhabda carinulata TaxID=1163345 RepID=UPI0025A1B77C|nr:organic cation transporter protein-like isoform X1 [Diorhabda carinulata]